VEFFTYSEENVGSEDLSTNHDQAALTFAAIPVSSAQLGAATNCQRKLTGVLRSFWDKDPVDSYHRRWKDRARNNAKPGLVLPETPITLANLDADRLAAPAINNLRTVVTFLTLAARKCDSGGTGCATRAASWTKAFCAALTAPRVRFVFQRREFQVMRTALLPIRTSIIGRSLLAFIQQLNSGRAVL